MQIKLISFILVTLLTFSFLSCSSKKSEQEKVTKTGSVHQETVHQERANQEVVNQERTVVVVKTEEKEEADSGGDFGIIGGLFGFLGEVIALPFKIVAGLIDFIF